jgi:hypothetical protein
LGALPANSMASSTTVPLGFHYETKYVVLSYLGFLPQEKLQEHHGPSPQGITFGFMMAILSQSKDLMCEVFVSKYVSIYMCKTM